MRRKAPQKDGLWNLHAAEHDYVPGQADETTKTLVSGEAYVRSLPQRSSTSEESRYADLYAQQAEGKSTRMNTRSRVLTTAAPRHDPQTILLYSHVRALLTVLYRTQ